MNTNKNLPLIFFIFSLLISISPNNAFAFSENQIIHKPIILEKIVITPTRSALSANRVAENITVISAENISNLPAQNLPEILQQVPGLNVQVTNKFGQSTALSIQGSDARQVLLMVDGIPFNTQLSGQANPSRIPLEIIDRIEIIKGASSSVWGSSLGGVINVITKSSTSTKALEGTLTSSYAGFKTTDNVLELHGKVNTINYLFSGKNLSTKGTLSRSSVHEKSGFGKISTPLGDEATIDASFGYSGASVYDGVRPNNRWYSSPYNTRYGKMSFNKESLHYDMNISYKYNDQDITSNSYSAATDALVFSTVSSNVYHGLSLNSTVKPSDTDTFVAGADFDWTTFKSSHYLPSSKHISMQAPYLNYTKNINNWDLLASLRFDNNAHFGSQTSPGAGVVYHLKNKLNTKLRARVTRAFNAPPLLWLYNDDATYFVGANPDLKAERAMTYEVGVSSKLCDRATLDLNLHYADIKDAIATTFENGRYRKKNFKKFKRQGAELSLNIDLNDYINLFASSAFNDVRNKTTNELVRDQGVARQSFSIGTYLKNNHGLKVSIIGTYNRWMSDPSLEANDQKFIWNAKLSQSFPQTVNNIDLKLFFNIYNLTNSKYWSAISYPLPKRYYEGGFSLNF
ncbi:TonB-dependent receptor plug domain-containing protein [Candidatus Omnitrophota bacterium]